MVSSSSFSSMPMSSFGGGAGSADFGGNGESGGGRGAGGLSSWWQAFAVGTAAGSLLVWMGKKKEKSTGGDDEPCELGGSASAEGSSSRNNNNNFVAVGGNPGHAVYESVETLDEYLSMHFDDTPVRGVDPMAARFPEVCARKVVDVYARIASNDAEKKEGWERVDREDPPGGAEAEGTKKADADGEEETWASFAGSRALDIGCAVGRSSFELARSFEEVVGIDFSGSFVRAGQKLQEEGSMPFKKRLEGAIISTEMAVVHPHIDRKRVSFEQGDACALRDDLGSFDAVLGANLLCRLPAPRAFLARLQTLVRPGGIAVLPSPYTWLPEFTHPSKWVGGRVVVDPATGEQMEISSAMELREIMEQNGFDLLEESDLPFTIRKTARRNEYTFSHCTVWRRRVDGC